MGLIDTRIILVEPAGPLNVGSVARVMKNMGLQELVLVNPQCDYRGVEARLMAVHAQDVLASAQVVETVPEALSGCQRAAATTSVDRTLKMPLESPGTVFPWLLETPSALIFGREDHGLTNIELNYAQRLIRIPTDEGYPSLNLAQAVAICSYELYQASQAVPRVAIPAEETAVSLEVLESYYQHLEQLLLNIGYLYPQTVDSRMQKFRQIFNRAALSSQEVALLRGILSQVEWALKTAETGKDNH